MTTNQAALWRVVITGCFVLGTNLVTAFGPSWLSWGKKPSFVDTEVYKELERDNSRLSQTLEEQLMHITSYYLSRDLVFEFKEKRGDRIIIEARNTTVVKNALNRTLTYEHSVTFLEDTQYLSLSITDEGGRSLKLDSRDLSDKRAKLPSGIVSTKVPWEIPAKGKITVESRYMMTRPLWYEEPMVTRRLIAGPMKVTIRKPPSLDKLVLGYETLAFEGLGPEMRDADKNIVITIPGPVFSSQGVAIAWKWQG